MMSDSGHTVTCLMTQVAGLNATPLDRNPSARRGNTRRAQGDAQLCYAVAS